MKAQSEGCRENWQNCGKAQIVHIDPQGCTTLSVVVSGQERCFTRIRAVRQCMRRQIATSFAHDYRQPFLEPQ